MKAMRFSPFVLLVFTLVGVILPGRIWGQVYLGAIKGETQDVKHANLPNVKLTLLNEGTGVARTTASGPSGEFSVLDLSPGAYSLTAEASGFKTSVLQHIVVSVNTTVPLIVTLQVGQVQQSVVVSADTAVVETQTSDVGTAITPEEIKDLPLNLVGDMRNPLNFVLLTPGVSGSQPGATPDYRLHFSGSVSYGDEVYIDGVPIMDTDLPGEIGPNHPPVDAISQFKLINNNESAQYGLASGIVSFGFKSGTNEFHGSAFDYLQNSALDAAGFTTDSERASCILAGTTAASCAQEFQKPPLKQNEYGGTIGGPVLIPKFDHFRGNKAFFFVDYTGFKYRPSVATATLTTFPTPFRTGDFSAVLGPQLTVGGSPVFDPAGNPVYQGEIYNPLTAHNVVGPDGNTYQVRDPFPGNMIPSGTSGLSAASQNILKYFPVAANDNIVNNLYRLLSSKINEDRVVVKIDDHLSDKHTIFGSILSGPYTDTNNGGLNELDSIDSHAQTTQIRLTYNYMHSPTMFNNVNVGFIRDAGGVGPLQDIPAGGLGALGLTGIPAWRSNSPFPLIAISTQQNSIGEGSASFYAENRYFVNDNLTLIRGSHSFTMGGELRWQQRNEYGTPGGSFTFEPLESALNGTGFAGGQAIAIPDETGNAAASFLFGGVDFINVSYPIESAYRWQQVGVYLQDDWRVNSNLTLNLGLRYDVQVPRSDAHGNISTMDPNVPNPDAGYLLGTMVFYGHGAGRLGTDRIGSIDFNGAEPRIGFAYSPGTTHKTSIRGGFALSRPIGNDDNESGISGTQYTSGFSGAVILEKPGDYVGDPAYYWDSAPPSSSVFGYDLSPSLFVGNNNEPEIKPISGTPPTQLYWDMQIERQLMPSLIATVGYVGMHTYHLGVWSKPNEVNPTIAQEEFSSVAQADGLPLNVFLSLPITDPRVQAAGISLPTWPSFLATFGGGATASQALRPNPQYGDTDNPLNPIANVTYNGLQTSLKKNFSHGLTTLLSFTWSKTIGDADSNLGSTAGAENAIYAGSFFQDYYNPRAERAVTSSDIPVVVALSYSYELPFGQNKRFLNHGGVLNEVAGGWSVSGIQEYQSGNPIHIEYDAFGTSDPYHAAGDGYSFRPDLVPGVPLKNPSYKRSCTYAVLQAAGRTPCQFYVNPAAFTLPPSGDFGDAPNENGNLREPAFLDEDLSISKRTKLYENLDLQFQANFFNAFNRTIFSNGGDAQTFISQYAPPDLTSASLQNTTSIFGILNSQQNSPRLIQFGMKLEF